MSDNSPARPCGCALDAPEHLEPEPDWIGNTPIMHGEREGSWFATPEQELFGGPCLCGHPTYMLCPEDWGVDVGGVSLRWHAADEGGERGYPRG